MRPILAIMRRELRSYFVTPLAYVFLVIFLFLAGVLTFYLGDFYERGLADLQPFFDFHPWLYLVFAPALTMRLWAEERKSGTLELLFTLPVSLTQAMLGKFLAAWAFVALALALSFPMWLTVNYLGHPDNGVILAGYLGSLLMAGAFLAVGCCLSTTTRSQVVAFVISVAVCFLLVMAGQSGVHDLLSGLVSPQVATAVSQMSILGHFRAIARGVLDLRDMIYFALSIVIWLSAGVVVLQLKREG